MIREGPNKALERTGGAPVTSVLDLNVGIRSGELHSDEEEGGGGEDNKSNTDGCSVFGF